MPVLSITQVPYLLVPINNFVKYAGWSACSHLASFSPVSGVAIYGTLRNEAKVIFAPPPTKL